MTTQVAPFTAFALDVLPDCCATDTLDPVTGLLAAGA
jgi:hypothetical protein